MRELMNSIDIADILGDFGDSKLGSKLYNLRSFLTGVLLHVSRSFWNTEFSILVWCDGVSAGS